MYSSNKKTSSDNTITVTPIKVEMSSISQSYPAPSSSGGSVALAATNDARRLSQPAPTTETTLLSHPGSVAIINTNTGTTPKEKLTKTPRVLPPRKPPPTIDTFWPTIMAEVRGIQQVDAKHQALPLARIKKIMKLDENAKMIAAEAPLLFAKACEYFIQELTMRAWIHTEESKRRTLQRSDIAQAIANYDQFDFLIDIVPREDIKPAAGSHKKESQTTSSAATGSGVIATSAANTTSTSCAMSGGGLKIDQQELQHHEMISFATLPTEAALASSQHLHHQQQQHHQQALVPQQQLQIIQQQAAQPQQMQYFITTTPEALAHNQQQQAQAAPQQQLQIIQQSPHPQYFITTHAQPQQLILTTGPNGQLTATPAPTAATAQQQQTALLQNLANQQQQQQQIQLLQQVVTPTGELTNVPITISANQLNLLRLQMQAAPQQLLQLSAAASAPNTTVTSAPTHNLVASQGLQQHHQQQHNPAGTANIYLNAATSQSTQIPSQANTSIVSTDRNLGSTFRQNC